MTGHDLVKRVKTENIHINDIKNGDVILHDGKERTVNDSNIRRCDFMGVSVFGDCYNLGNKHVIKVIKGA